MHVCNCSIFFKKKLNPYFTSVVIQLFGHGGDPIHAWFRSLVDPAAHPLEENPKNPWVMRANNIETGDEGFLKGRNKRLGSLDYAEHNRGNKSTDRIPIHRTCPPIHGRGKNFTSGLQQIHNLRAHYVFVFCLFVRWKHILLLLLIFLFLIISFFSSFAHPLIGPTPPVEFSVREKSHDSSLSIVLYMPGTSAFERSYIPTDRKASK